MFCCVSRLEQKGKRNETGRVGPVGLFGLLGPKPEKKRIGLGPVEFYMEMWGPFRCGVHIEVFRESG